LLKPSSVVLTKYILYMLALIHLPAMATIYPFMIVKLLIFYIFSCSFTYNESVTSQRCVPSSTRLKWPVQLDIFTHSTLYIVISNQKISY